VALLVGENVQRFRSLIFNFNARQNIQRYSLFRN